MYVYVPLLRDYWGIKKKTAGIPDYVVRLAFQEGLSWSAVSVETMLAVRNMHRN